MSSPIERVLEALRNMGSEPKRTGDSWAARCPAHDDNSPSLSVTEARDGKALIHCHAGCGKDDILEALGLRAADLFPEREPRKPTPQFVPTKLPERHYPTAEDAIAAYHKGQPTGLWQYTDAAGEPVGYAVRWDTARGKDIRPVARNGSGWLKNGMHEPRPLYNLPAVLKADTVFVAEGEKCADAITGLGVTATTSSQGSQGSAKTDWTPLAGKRVFIVADNDDAGRIYAVSVAEKAAAAGAESVEVIDLRTVWNDMPKGGDIADLVGEDGPWSTLEPSEIVGTLQRIAQPVETDDRPKPDDMFELVHISEIGEAEPPDWLCQPIIAYNHITMLYGLWKSGKTTLINNLLRDLYREQGGELASYQCEGRTMMISEEHTNLWANRRDDLGLADSKIYLMKRQNISRCTTTEWIELLSRIRQKVVEEDYRFVVFDTITNAWPVENENDASEVTNALKPVRMVSDAGAAVLLIHHPKKGGGSQGTGARGSGAFSGFVDIHVEFKRYNPDSITDTRRSLEVLNRIAPIEDDIILDWGTNGYAFEGGRRSVQQDDMLRGIQKVLEANPKGLTPDGIRSAWGKGHGKKPPKNNISGILNCPTNLGIRWKRTGTGHRGNPYLYLPK